MKLTEKRLKEIIREEFNSLNEAVINERITKDKHKNGEFIHKAPKNINALRDLVSSEMDRLGTDADLNHIDVSKCNTMHWLFAGGGRGWFNGDISEWDVSNVEDMYSMFKNSEFNGDISKWDVSNCETLRDMFRDSKFNGDISKWDVSSVTNMSHIFGNSKFDGNISKWDISNLEHKNIEQSTVQATFDTLSDKNKPKALSKMKDSQLSHKIS